LLLLKINFWLLLILLPLPAILKLVFVEILVFNVLLIALLLFGDVLVAVVDGGAELIEDFDLPIPINECDTWEGSWVVNDLGRFKNGIFFYISYIMQD